MNTIQINFAFDFCCLMFMIFLIGIYLSKKNANNLDNKIYKQLLLWNILTIIFNTLYPITIFYINTNLAYVLARIYSFCLLYYFYFLTVYIITISRQHDKEFIKKIENHYNLFYIIIFLVGFIFGGPLFILPLHMEITPNDLLLSGILIPYISAVQGVLALIVIAVIAIFKKQMDKSKLIPFYVLGGIGVSAVTFSIFFPSLVTVIIILTVVSYLMYHTIENPDMKMVNELTLARDQAEKATKVKSEFLSSMSHELRTPLNAILGLSQMINSNDNLEEIHQDSNDIIKSSQKLLELVDGILLSNNIDNNTVEIVNSNYNLKELIDNVVHNTKVLIGEKNVQFKTMISDDIPTNVYGDREKVKVILNNLLSNAVKYTEQGFIELSISSLINKDKCNLRITVSDTGKGINDEEVNNIFDKFYRSQENKDSDIEGTGLGLSITKSLVELLDGKITVNSTEGEGTTFTITLTQGIVNDNNDVETL